VREGEECKCNIAERRNTVVCTFDPITPKVTAYDIQEWIHDILWNPEKAVNMMQIDGLKQQVHIKLAYTQGVNAVLRDMCGQAEYGYSNEEMSTVIIAMAVM